MSARHLVWLAAIGGACSDPVAVARASLAAADPATRLAGACTLAEAGPAAAVAVPDLIVATGDASAGVADVAVWALAAIGPAAAAAVPHLLSLPVDGQPLRHLALCVALGKIGGGRDEVVARLQRDAQSPLPIVRQAARGALRSAR